MPVLKGFDWDNKFPNRSCLGSMFVFRGEQLSKGIQGETLVGEQVIFSIARLGFLVTDWLNSIQIAEHIFINHLIWLFNIAVENHHF